MCSSSVSPSSSEPQATRFRLLLSYDGTAFRGWQIQSVDRSVQGELHDALSTMCCRPMKVAGASRTDAGVHAEGQVASFDYSGRLTKEDFARGLNGLLPDDISISHIEAVEPPFHARHSARGKSYVYQLWNHPRRNPFLLRYSWWLRGVLDLDALHCAAQAMVGEHDFAAMRAADCSSETTVRFMRSIEVCEPRPHLLQVVVTGSSFLKQMVRNMVGTLVDVGQGRIPAPAVADILKSADRCNAGRTAPAHGLILRRVFYPDHPWSSPPDTDDFLGQPYLTENAASSTLHKRGK